MYFTQNFTLLLPCIVFAESLLQYHSLPHLILFRELPTSRVTVFMLCIHFNLYATSQDRDHVHCCISTVYKVLEQSKY